MRSRNAETGFIIPSAGQSPESSKEESTNVAETSSRMKREDTHYVSIRVYNIDLETNAYTNGIRMWKTPYKVERKEECPYILQGTQNQKSL